MIFTILFYSILFATSLLTILHFYLQGNKRARILEKVPGPKALPILGNITNFSFLPLETLWKTMRTVAKDYYPIFRAWGLHWNVIILYDPDDIEAILSSMKHIHKDKMYSYMHPWLGTGLLTSNGRKWHDRRKMLTYSFHFNVLEKFLINFQDHAKGLVKSLKNGNHQPTEANVVPIFSRHALKVICETAMGVTLENTTNWGKKYMSSISQMAQLIVYRVVRPWLFSDVLFSLTSAKKAQVDALGYLHAFTNRIIRERKEYHQERDGMKDSKNGETQEGGEEILQFGRKRKMAMLDFLIANWREGKIDDVGIREEVDTFVFEGHDTTSAALTFIVMSLAEHKECQDRCREEVDELFNRKDENLTIPDFQQLNYLEQCIKESMRLYPSVPQFSRTLQEDLHLKNYVIPAETIVLIFAYDVHRDPNHWSNPDTFDPDRFSPERSAKRHPFAYIPFSAGPRNCIGQKFAMLEMKATLAYILREFYLEPIDTSKTVQFVQDLILRTTTPVRVRFVPRH